MYQTDVTLYQTARGNTARDFDTFAGYSLERYFQWKFTEDTDYTRMGAWWDRKGENEIDLVCEDEFGEKLDFREVKIDAARYQRDALVAKTVAFFEKHPEKKEMTHTVDLLSLRDM